VGPFRQASSDGGKNHLHHPVAILQHVVIPEADHLSSGGLQRRCATMIAGASLVLPAIHLHHPRFAAHEIGDGVSDHKLACESRAILSEHAPQALLRIGWGIA
jgi:hypothetical protein